MGRVRAVFVRRPRLARTKVAKDLVKQAVPELFDNEFPVLPVLTYGVTGGGADPMAKEISELYASLNIVGVPEIFHRLG